MPALLDRYADVQARLDALARRHSVAGATLGILDGDDVVEWATGVVNAGTGVETTTDSLFQIGSNTKVITATLTMRLAEEGLFDLDEPLRTYLPELKVGDARTTERITIRHLLTHTSGLQGDFFPDTGKGDDSVERYVSELSRLKRLHAIGERFTYCNSGFVLLGRAIEAVTGETWHRAVTERVFRPLGMSTTTVFSEEAMTRRVAIGHAVSRRGATPVPIPQPWMPFSSGPAGSLTWAPAREVLDFVRFHLDGGVAMDGERLLSEASVTAMQQPQAELPPLGMADHVGLSWLLQQWGGERVIGHGGGTFGQLSYMQVLPDRRQAVCILTNSTSGGLLIRDLARSVWQDLAGVTPTEVPERPGPAPDLDLEPYTGKYSRYGTDVTVTIDEDDTSRLAMTVTPTATELPASEYTLKLRPMDAVRFHTKMPPLNAPALVGFLDPDREGRPRHVFFGGRVAPRAGRTKRT